MAKLSLLGFFGKSKLHHSNFIIQHSTLAPEKTCQPWRIGRTYPPWRIQKFNLAQLLEIAYGLKRRKLSIICLIVIPIS
jgi:hypothetical protein